MQLAYTLRRGNQYHTTVIEAVDSLEPDISVIMPAYNAALTLEASLAALRASIGPSIEVILVDDCSTDRTAEIAEGAGVRVVRLPRQSGAAVARNAGAHLARADLLFFTDSDVMVRPDAIARAVRVLRDEPTLSAVFGSYTAATVHANFSSRYKNLVHHLTHQAARPEAKTFWGAAGAVRSADFWAVDGFDPRDTRTADVEDIALGYRLSRRGYQIRLDRDLQVMHAKRYDLFSLIRSDVVHRAIPWTRLMLRERMYQRDLNTTDSSLSSAAAVLLFGPALLAGMFHPLGLAVAGLLLATFLFLNRRLFAALARHGGLRFALASVPMTALYYVYATFGALIGLALHIRQPRHAPRSDGILTSPHPSDSKSQVA